MLAGSFCRKMSSELCPTVGRVFGGVGGAMQAVGVARIKIRRCNLNWFMCIVQLFYTPRHQALLHSASYAPNPPGRTEREPIGFASIRALPTASFGGVSREPLDFFRDELRRGGPWPASWAVCIFRLH